MIADLMKGNSPGRNLKIAREFALKYAGIDLKIASIDENGLIALANRPCDLYYFSHDKVNIVYPHVLRAALKFPRHNILYRLFYEKHSILAPLAMFYSKFDWLIPKNVTLKFYQYCTQPTKASGFSDGLEPELRYRVD